MTRLTELSMRNRTLVGLAAVLVGIFGVISMVSLKQELIPSLQLPIATVVGQFPGASPTVVAQQVTAPVEAAVQEVSGVITTSSTSSGGVSAVNVEMEYGTDLTAVQRDLQQAVSAIRGLPQGVEPVVVTGSTDDFPVVQLAVSSPQSEAALTQLLREQVVPRFEDLDGVNEVTLSGIGERMVSIDLDPAALADRGVSPFEVSSTLQDNGVRVPAGTVGSGERELSVQVGAPIRSLDELRELPLPSLYPGAGLVPLGDVARVDSQFVPSTGFSRTDGRPSIGIGITKVTDSNTVAVSHAVADLLPEIEDLLGPDSAVTVVFDQAPFIEQSIEDLTTEGLLGLTFAVLVILLFLLSLRSTLVTAVSIPLSLLIALISLYLNGYSLNILTLGALTIAVGRVVDDSIVVIENIKRHLGYGEPMRQAVLGAVREVASAIIASTVTTVAVFLPIGLVGGQVGELFRPFAVTITAALLGSLLVSLTIVPVLASWFLKPVVVDEPADEQQIRAEEMRSPLQRGYLPVLRAALARPLVTCGVAGLVLVATFAMAPLLKTNFLSDSGQNTFQISQELPPGTGLATTDAAARRVEQTLADTAGVTSYQTQVGSPGGSSLAALGGEGVTSNTVSYFVTTDVDADQAALQDEVRDRLTALADAGTITVQSGGGPGGTALEVVVRAEDEAVLTEAAGIVTQAVREVEGAVDVKNGLADEQLTVDVAVDRRAAAAAGLSDQQIGQAVTTALRGAPVGTLALDGVPQAVVLRTGLAPADLDALRALPLGPVTLGEVATVREVPQQASITRIDGTRSTSITATPDTDDLRTVTADLQQKLGEVTLPAGATAEIGGVSADQDEAFGQLGLALALAIAIVYLVMVATFRSLVQPLLLLVSIPFAATGALGLLVITGTPLGVPALIGMLMLIGIVVTNAIVLIDRVNQYRTAGASSADAVIDGARQRLRPILMTAVATICALFPMSLGLSGGGLFISQPLAVVVIGGLISSTALTLILVPVLYSLVDRARTRLSRRRAPSPTDPSEPPTSELQTAELRTAELRTPVHSTSATSAPVPPSPTLVPPSDFSYTSDFSYPPASPEPPAPESFSPEPFSPEPFSPEQFSPERYSPEPFSPERYSPEPFSPEPFSPEPFSPEPVGPEPDAAEPAAVEPTPGAHRANEPAAPAWTHSGPSVAGLVVTLEGTLVSGAVLTLVDSEGSQVDQSTSAEDGSYELIAPSTGSYLLICRSLTGDRDPQAAWVLIRDEPTRHHITLTHTTAESPN